MNKASIPTLELLRDTGAALPPSAILVNLHRELDDPPSRSTLYNALGDLVENGFVATVDLTGIGDVDGTYYRITELGIRYLIEDLTTAEDEELREN